MKHNYMVIAFLGIQLFSFVHAHTKHTNKHHHSGVSSSVTKHNKSNKHHNHDVEKKSSHKKPHIHPLRPAKNNAPGVAVCGISIKGSKVVPFEKSEQHDAMMHLYVSTFKKNGGYVLDVAQAAQSSLRKEVLNFKNVAQKVCAHTEDAVLLLESMHCYDKLVIFLVDAFKKQRAAKVKLSVNKKLEAALKRAAHGQPLLTYAVSSLAHSKLLLQEYAFNVRLVQHIASIEKSLKQQKMISKFSALENIQARDRMIALIVLLEGAVVHYGAMIESYATDAQKQSVNVDNMIELIIKEIKDIILS